MTSDLSLIPQNRVENLSTNLSSKADDSTVVKLTGNQTIAGIKTFTNGIVSSTNIGVNNGSVLLRQGSNYYYFLDRTDLATSETTPDATKYEIMIARAYNGDNLGQLMWYQLTDGRYVADLSVHRKVNSVEKSASINVNIDSSGTICTYAPTPATSDNSTQIATTAFVKAQGYLTTAANQDLSNLTSGLTNTICTTAATTTSSASTATPAVIKENYVSGTEWYRVWSDGWIEQGGICASHQYNTTLQQVNFYIPYKNTNYMALTCAGPTTGQLWQIATRIAVKTTTGLDIRGGQNANAAYTGDAAWYTCGY